MSTAFHCAGMLTCLITSFLHLGRSLPIATAGEIEANLQQTRVLSDGRQVNLYGDHVAIEMPNHAVQTFQLPLPGRWDMTGWRSCVYLLPLESTETGNASRNQFPILKLENGALTTICTLDKPIWKSPSFYTSHGGGLIPLIIDRDCSRIATLCLESGAWKWERPLEQYAVGDKDSIRMVASQDNLFLFNDTRLVVLLLNTGATVWNSPLKPIERTSSPIAQSVDLWQPIGIQHTEFIFVIVDSSRLLIINEVTQALQQYLLESRPSELWGRSTCIECDCGNHAEGSICIAVPLPTSPYFGVAEDCIWYLDQDFFANDYFVRLDQSIGSSARLMSQDSNSMSVFY